MVFSLWQAGRGWVFGVGAVGIHASLLALTPPLPVPETVAAEPLLWLTTDAAEPLLSHEGSTVPDGAEEAGDEPATIDRHRMQARPRSRARRAAARGGRRSPSEPARVVDGEEPSLAVAAGTEVEPGQEGTEEGAVGGDAAGSEGGADGVAAGSAGGAGTGSAGSHGAGAGQPGAHGPRLLSRGFTCGSYFPLGASAARGSVQVQVRVDAMGRAHVDRVLVERPRGQGFEGAARACVQRLRFEPAADPLGHAVAGLATLSLNFDQS